VAEASEYGENLCTDVADDDLQNGIERSEEKLKRRLSNNDRVALQDTYGEVITNECREFSNGQQDGALNRRKDDRRILANECLELRNSASELSLDFSDNRRDGSNGGIVRSDVGYEDDKIYCSQCLITMLTELISQWLDLGEDGSEDHSDRGDRNLFSLNLPTCETKVLVKTRDIRLDRGNRGNGNAREGDGSSVGKGAAKSGKENCECGKRAHFVKIVGCLVRRRVFRTCSRKRQDKKSIQAF
jgi:hypothetical protein